MMTLFRKGIFEYQHFDKCPDCGSAKGDMITPGGINLGKSFMCECAYNREMAKMTNEKAYHKSQIIKGLFQSSNLSLEHLDIIRSEDFDDSAALINKARDYYRDGLNNFLYLMSGSGTGKTIALHWIANNLITEKLKRVGYFVAGDLIEILMDYSKKKKIDDLLKYDYLIMDDFLKGEDCPVKVQDLLKRLIDLFIRHKKIILFGSDIDLPTSYGKLDAEYKKQITDRIAQQSGRYIIGLDNLPNRRRAVQQNLL
jgi:DNA replication protein DnaC